MRVVIDKSRIRNAWHGRVSGCLLGKAVETLSIMEGREGLIKYLKSVEAVPLRDYIPLTKGSLVEMAGPCCKGYISRSEPDDDINYTVLALLMLEEYGLDLRTEDVGRSWLKYLPAGMTFTAERAAYTTLIQKSDFLFTLGGQAGFDLAECADNEWSDWIGAQIRADLYGWVCPGKPALGAELARRDAALSHTGEGVYGAAFVAALGASIPVTDSMADAVAMARHEIPDDSDVAGAVAFASSLAGNAEAVDKIHERYEGMSPIHTVNNLSLVVWALLSYYDDYSAAIGSVVEAGWDTDCNGATVGGLWGLQGKQVPGYWTEPWQGRVAVTLAGIAELSLEDLVDRTVKVAEGLSLSVGKKPSV